MHVNETGIVQKQSCAQIDHVGVHSPYVCWTYELKYESTEMDFSVFENGIVCIECCPHTPNPPPQTQSAFIRNKSKVVPKLAIACSQNEIGILALMLCTILALLSTYSDNPPSKTMFCPVTLLFFTNVRTCSATSSTAANLFNLDASVIACILSGGNFSPHS